jgi:hypothetical protein
MIAGRMQVKDLIGSALEYSHVDPLMAHHLWVLVFPICWATLENAAGDPCQANHRLAVQGVACEADQPTPQRHPVGWGLRASN